MNTRAVHLSQSDEYWQKKADLFSRIYSTGQLLLLPNRLFLKHRLAIVQKYITEDAEATTLDIGCGSGEFTEMLAAHYGQVVGIDYSSIMLELAQKNVPSKNIEWRRADCTQIPLEAQSVDNIFALGLLDYISDFEATFQEFTRLLKPGGSLVFTVPKTPSLFEPLRWSSTLRQKVFKIPPIVNAVSRKQVNRLMEEFDLEILNITSLWTAMWIIYAQNGE